MASAQDANSQDNNAADVRLLIDVSGSMKANDPANLRASGVRLLVDLLPLNTRAGLWTFGARVANPLPMDNVDDSWRQKALAVLPQLSDYQQFTDLEAALKSVTPEGQRNNTRHNHVILLTDGMVDIPANGQDKAERDAASRQRILTQLAPRLAGNDVVVHTIALSHNADANLLRDLAQRTGGLAAVAETSEALLRSFLDVLDQVVPSEQVPLIDGRFSIDDRVDEFTALIFHDDTAAPITLVGPNGERIQRDDVANDSGVHWRGDRRYDLITVPSPTPGEWHVEGQVGPGSRILITSSLMLKTSSVSATLYQYFDVPLDAWLTENGEPYAAEGDMTVSARLRDNNGNEISTVLTRDEDGHYRGTLVEPELLGNARLSVLASGADFQRLRVQSVNVAPAISAALAPDQSSIALQAAHPRLDSSNTTLTATLQGESLAVETRDDKHWRVALPADLPEQSVPVVLDAQVTLDGETRHIPLPPVRLNEEARIGLSGASLDRAAVNAEQLPDEPQQEKKVQDQQWSLQRVWETLKPWWPTVERYVQEYVRKPWVWAVIGVLVLLFLITAMRRRQQRRRRRQQRREPHV
ncbi:VWA domain-containing protein [Phytohalomonas tamaricis]|uniref:VWA domain-containing protein n=1 Tax=Phytohalomonas tamaricis TaxID=2081032 RepID=UPI00131A0852|nr:vWA domain-containing protein [Phytohalomonas tamaricis]